MIKFCARVTIGVRLIELTPEAFRPASSRGT